MSSVDSSVSQGMPVLMQGIRTSGTKWAGGNAGAVYCTLITAKLVHQQLKVPQTPCCMLRHTLLNIKHQTLNSICLGTKMTMLLHCWSTKEGAFAACCCTTNTASGFPI